MRKRQHHGSIVGWAVVACALAIVAALPGAAHSQDDLAVDQAAVQGCDATASVNTFAPLRVAALASGGLATVGPSGVHLFDAGGAWQSSFLQNHLLTQIDVGDDGRLAVSSTSEAATWIVDPVAESAVMVPIEKPFRPTSSFWADATSLFTYNVSTGISLASITDGSVTRVLRPLPTFATPIASDRAGRLYLDVPVPATLERTLQRVNRDGSVELEFTGVGGLAGFTIDPATDRLVQVGESTTVYADDGTIAESYPFGFPDGVNAAEPAILADGRLLATNGETFYAAPSLADPAVVTTPLSRPGFVTDAPGHALGRGSEADGRWIVSRIDTQSGAIVSVAGNKVVGFQANEFGASVIRAVAGAGGAVHALVDSTTGQRGVAFVPSGSIEPVSADAVGLADATGTIRTVDLAGNLRSVYPPALAVLPGSGIPIVAAYVDDGIGLAYRLYPDGSVTSQSTNGGAETTVVSAASYPSGPTVHDLTAADGRIWVADSTNGFVAFSATDGMLLGVIDTIGGFGGQPVMEAVAVMDLDGLVVVDRGTLAIGLIGCSVLPAPSPILQPEFTG
jgi:hypothetical protein